MLCVPWLTVAAGGGPKAFVALPSARRAALASATSHAIAAGSSLFFKSVGAKAQVMTSPHSPSDSHAVCVCFLLHYTRGYSSGGHCGTVFSSYRLELQLLSLPTTPLPMRVPCQLLKQLAGDIVSGSIADSGRVLFAQMCAVQSETPKALASLLAVDGCVQLVLSRHFLLLRWCWCAGVGVSVVARKGANLSARTHTLPLALELTHTHNPSSTHSLYHAHAPSSIHT